MFYDILEERNAILGCKNKNFKKKGKMDIFFKRGLVHSFGQNMVVFPDFFFRENRGKNVFYDILEGRNAFLDYKNKKFKKSKNWDFSKG